MKIMGRVARLILLVVMFVCVVFCVLCCLQNNLVFLSVTYLNIKKWKLWAMYFDGFLRYNRKKKFQSSVWRKKKDTVVCLLGAWFWQLRPEKKRYSHLSGGSCCCIVSVFGSGGKLAVFLLWQEIFIMTGEKKVPVVCLVGVSVFGSGGKLAVFFVVAGKFYYDRKKKF